MWPFVPYGLYAGKRATTSQGFTEAHAKLGTLFEFAEGPQTLAPGASRDLLFTTGAKACVITDREVGFIGDAMTTRIYRSPIYTGGTSQSSSIFSLSDINPDTPTAVIRLGASVSSPGVEFGAPTYDLGIADIGNASTPAYSSGRIVRPLPPNTTYLQRITNTGTVSLTFTHRLTWYEGVVDLPA